jgi:hypothetical protein
VAFSFAIEPWSRTSDGSEERSGRGVWFSIRIFVKNDMNYFLEGKVQGYCAVSSAYLVYLWVDNTELEDSFLGTVRIRDGVE